MVQKPVATQAPYESFMFQTSHLVTPFKIKFNVAISSIALTRSVPRKPRLMQSFAIL